MSNLIGKRAWIGGSSPSPRKAKGHGVITSHHNRHVKILGDDGQSYSANESDVMIVPFQSHILDQIKKERTRQDDKFGSQSHKHELEWLAILSEEVGEVAKAILEDSDYEAEMLQVASVAVAALEAWYVQREERMKQGYKEAGDRISEILRGTPE